MSDNKCMTDCCYMRVACRELSVIRGKISIIIHGPVGCGSDYGVPGNMPSVRCTEMQEMDIVMGGEDSLKRKIDETIEKDSPELIFVLSTCASELIGDDIESIASSYNVPIIPMHTSGLCGFNEISEKGIILNPLINDVMRKRNIVKGSLNYFGDIWMNGDRFKRELKKYLSEIGIKTNLVMAGDVCLEDIKKAPESEINLFTDIGYAENFGNMMSKRFRQRTVKPGIPLGIRGTSLFYHRIAQEMGFDIKENIEEWEKIAKTNMMEKAARLKGKVAAVYGKNIHVARAFAELGMTVHIICKLSDKEKKYCRKHDITISEDIGDFDLVFNPAEKKGLKSAFIHPLEQYLLYSGMSRLADDMINELEHPFRMKYPDYLEEVPDDEHP